MTHEDPTGAALLGTASAMLSQPQAWPDADVAIAGEDPTSGSAGAAIATVASELGGPPVAAPEIPIPIRLRNISGSYSGVSGGFELDLRVDVDGIRPMRRVSGDFIAISGATRTYFGSFVVDVITTTNTPAGEVVRGLGRFTFSAGAPVVQVTVPRRTIFQPAAPATVQFFTTGGSAGAVYACNYTSAYFRTVTLQTERVSDVPLPVFASYNTGSLPSGGATRTLSVVSAYAEAGVQMITAPSGPVIDISGAGPDRLWSNAELLASMQAHFAHYGTAPHWDMWQAECLDHEIGPGLYGIMFDSQGRQGCAVFYRGIGGVTADKLRLQLYTHVHELGHCFNLMHSWQKSLAKPPGVDNPSALSWMNYPWNYPGGADAFWGAFPFAYVDGEIVHLRHGFRNNVIPDANPFTVGAAVIDPEVMSDPISDGSGLEFTIVSAHPTYMLGEPVVVHLALRSFDRRGRLVHGNLNPRTSGVSLAIARPDGQAVRFEPLVDCLMATEPFLLTEGEIADSAYIGFSKDGLLFDRPGSYKLRAIYHAPDGSRVMSNVETLRVGHPASRQDNEVADLLLGDEQGALFALRGSDAQSLASGNAAFDEVLDRHGTHPLADYVRLAKGVNHARTFKTLDPSAVSRLRVRKADLSGAQAMLSAAAAETSRVDALTKAKGLERLASAYEAADQPDQATSARKESGALRASRRRT